MHHESWATQTYMYTEQNGMLLPEKRPFTPRETTFQQKEISPSRRTASPLLTDYESEAFGLGVCINRTERKS